MEPEIHPSGGDDGGGAPEPETEPTTTETEGGGDAPGGEPTTEPAERQLTGRQARKQEYRDRHALEKTIREMTRHNKELSSKLEQALGRMGDVVERSAPPREDPLAKARKDLDEKWDKVVSRLDKDPAAAGEFRDLQLEYGRLGAREEAAQRARETPAPASPLAQSLFVEFPWLHPETGDGEARAMVNGYAARLARTEKRDMNNPQVRYTTLRQAAAMAAKDLDYPVPQSWNGNGNGGRERVTGTGGRGGTGGGGGPDNFVGMEGDIEAAATIMYPSLDKAAAVAKWKNTVGKRYMAAAK